MKIDLSVVIVAKNEDKNLEDCLKSVLWASEILVFDNDSADNTPEIAVKYATKVYKILKGNFSDRKNKAFDKTKHNWVLSLDADERVPSSLRKEIEKTIRSSTLDNSAYAIPRKNVILGREFKHGGQWPDYVIRLFRKKYLKGWTGKLHEQPRFDGKLGYLKNPLNHFKHDNFSDMVDKTNNWSEVEAKLMFESNHPKMNLPRFTTAVFREFWLRMIKQRAFLDGAEGSIYATYQVFSRFLSYAKLWEMQLYNSKLKIQNE